MLPDKCFDQLSTNNNTITGNEWNCKSILNWTQHHSEGSLMSEIVTVDVGHWHYCSVNNVHKVASTRLNEKNAVKSVSPHPQNMA